MRYLIAVMLVMVMSVVAFAQETQPVVSLPAIWGTELISDAGPTVLLVKVWTPLDDARYKIKWVIFNEKGKRVRSGNSGWFWWGHGPQIYFEVPVEPYLQGDGYYVKTVLQYAPYVSN